MTASPVELPEFSRSVIIQEAKYEEARRDFRAFKRFCQVQYRNESTGATGVCFMDPAWDAHMAAFEKRLLAGEDCYVLKSRQSGYSWDIAAYSLWRMQYKASLPILLYSQGEEEASELLRRVVFLYDRLPPALRVSLEGRPTKTRMEGAGTGVFILAMPSTERAGRSYTADHVVFDEFAQHAYGQQNYAAARPMARQVIVVSTSNGPNFFRDMWWPLYEEADPAAIFVPWSAVPGREGAWYERAKAGWRGLAEDFQREYPGSPAEAFAALSGLVYKGFDPGVHVVEEDPFRWEDAKVRVAGVDWGAGDPTAVVTVGLSGRGRVHQFEEFYERGQVAIEDVIFWLKQQHARAPLHHVACDPSEGQAVASLVRAGLPAQPGDNRRVNLGLVAGLFEQRRLTIARRCRNSVQEFSTYRWRRTLDPNSKDRYETGRAVDHHGDAMDARRYALTALEQWGVLGGIAQPVVGRRDLYGQRLDRAAV